MTAVVIDLEQAIKERRALAEARLSGFEKHVAIFSADSRQNDSWVESRVAAVADHIDELNDRLANQSATIEGLFAEINSLKVRLSRSTQAYGW